MSTFLGVNIFIFVLFLGFCCLGYYFGNQGGMCSAGASRMYEMIPVALFLLAVDIVCWVVYLVLLFK